MLPDRVKVSIHGSPFIRTSQLNSRHFSSFLFSITLFCDNLSKRNGKVGECKECNQAKSPVYHSQVRVTGGGGYSRASCNPYIHLMASTFKRMPKPMSKRVRLPGRESLTHPSTKVSECPHPHGRNMCMEVCMHREKTQQCAMQNVDNQSREGPRVDSRGCPPHTHQAPQEDESAFLLEESLWILILGGSTLSYRSKFFQKTF